MPAKGYAGFSDESLDAKNSDHSAGNEEDEEESSSGRQPAGYPEEKERRGEREEGKKNQRPEAGGRGRGSALKNARQQRRR